MTRPAHATARVLARWFPVLREPAARLYLTGQMVAVNGSWIQDITLNLLVWQLTGSPALLGAINFLLFGPVVVVAPLLGPRLGAHNARRVTLRILWSTLALAITLTTLAATDALSMPLITALALMRGVLTGMEMPARHMLLTTSIRKKTRIANALAANVVTFNLARMIGPAIAAALFATVGAPLSFLLGAATLVFMIFCVNALPLPATSHNPADAGMRPGIRSAAAYVRADRQASVFLPTVTLVGLFFGGYQTLVPALAEHVYGNAATWTGLLFGAAGAGSLCAGIVLMSSYMPIACRRWQVGMPWVVVLALLGLGLTTQPGTALACFYALGFGFTFTAAGFNSKLQQNAPPELRGALVGLYSMCLMGAMPIGHLLAGALAQWLSARQSLLVQAVLLALGICAVFMPRWIALGRIEFDADRI
ncbi:MAG: MFS transporter [Sulfuricaulis sp.]|nr:MFS transporter [Sulfuricaulis sp.]